MAVGEAEPGHAGEITSFSRAHLGSTTQPWIRSDGAPSLCAANARMDVHTDFYQINWHKDRHFIM